MQHQQKVVYTAIIFTLVGAFTTLLVLFAKGYNFSLSREKGAVALSKTGWLLIKSAPDGAKVFLDNEPVAPTNNSISNLEPREYTIRIQKEGYHEWRKTVPVKAELVTIVDALLIKKAVEIKPVTLTGIQNPTVDPTGTQILYFASGEKTGLWLYNLNDNFLSPSRANPHLLAEGTDFKDIKAVEWSEDKTQILLTVKYDNYGTSVSYLLNLDKINLPPFQLIQKTEELKESWQKERDLKRSSLLATLMVPEELKEIAAQPTTIFSPDEKKFLYTQEKDGQVEYHVVNLNDFLPVGTTLDSIAHRTNKESNTKIIWHTTGEHLIMIEGGSINLMELDGSNRTTVLATTLYDNLVVPTLNGRNLIISTSFTNDKSANLYNIFFN